MKFWQRAARRMRRKFIIAGKRTVQSQSISSGKLNVNRADHGRTRLANLVGHTYRTPLRPSSSSIDIRGATHAERARKGPDGNEPFGEKRRDPVATYRLRQHQHRPIANPHRTYPRGVGGATVSDDNKGVSSAIGRLIKKEALCFWSWRFGGWSGCSHTCHCN